MLEFNFKNQFIFNWGNEREFKLYTPVNIDLVKLGTDPNSLLYLLYQKFLSLGDICT